MSVPSSMRRYRCSKWHKRDSFLNTWAKQSSSWQWREITPHEIMYTLYSRGFMRWISSPPLRFSVLESPDCLKKRNGVQTEFGVLALWLWIQAYSWQIAVPSNARATAYAKIFTQKRAALVCVRWQTVWNTKRHIVQFRENRAHIDKDLSSTVLHWLGIILNPWWFTFLLFLISR